MITDQIVINAALNSISMAEAARNINMPYTTFIKRAKRLGVYRPNPGLKGTHKKSIRKYKVNDNAFDILDSKTCYWIGFLAVDGSIVDNTVRIILKGEDEQHLAKFIKFLESDYPVHKHTAHYTNAEGVHYFPACNIRVTSNKLVNRLKDFGIIQGKKYRDINFLENIPEKYKIDAIMGILDGDGGIHLSDTGVTITIACCKKTSVEIQKELNKYGINSTIYDRSTVQVISILARIDCARFCKLYIQSSKNHDTLERKLITAQKVLNIYG